MRSRPLERLLAMWQHAGTKSRGARLVVVVLFLGPVLLGGCGSLPLAASPTVTITKTVRVTSTIQERVTVTPTPEAAASSEEPQIEMGPPDGDGFFMPDLVGTEASTAYEFFSYEYGLSEGLEDYDVKRGSACNYPQMEVIEQVVPAPGTWVPRSQSGDMVRLYVGCE